MELFEGWIYRENLAFYDGPWDFYWSKYNGLLMLAFIFLGIFFKGRYKKTGNVRSLALANIFTGTGFGVIFLMIVIWSIESKDIWFGVVTTLICSAVFLRELGKGGEW